MIIIIIIIGNVSECFPVHFPEGATVGDHHRCTADTFLQAGRYRVRAEALALPENSPSVNTNDSATLIIHKS